MVLVVGGVFILVEVGRGKVGWGGVGWGEN
jgi:hypothetical protein